MKIIFLFLSILQLSVCLAQFKDDFESPAPIFKEQGLNGWYAATGDGTIAFKQKAENGIAILEINTHADKRNIWYVFIQQNIAAALDIKKLVSGTHVPQITAKVRSSHGPKRMNMYMSSGDNGFLREFDLEEAGVWYVITMSAKDFIVSADKPFLGQISMMDWGINETFQLEVDYIKVDVVDKKSVQHDSENAVLYRPPSKNKIMFQQNITVSDDAMIDRNFPDLNFNHWKANDSLYVGTANQSARILLKWDISTYKGKKIVGDGQLEIITHSVSRLTKNPKDFGEIRIFEILGGDAEWQEEAVTWTNLLQGSSEAKVINTQTIVDTPVKSGYTERTVVTISRPVLQRIIDGKTSGIAIGPLGAIDFSMLCKENVNGKFAAQLRFNVEP